uniref:Myb-like domain-containing protein n=1 Tax=Palpitomonas bilix TaxID=652834 RepID=A0A7S3G4R3_9EUKA|mmetsp:Transcript_28965/g.74391  ORF Transcript_28965/g.74391 Transcript_28965/m.74391 type:complete len:154 (+) Transcript_28965:108-569(+)
MASSPPPSSMEREEEEVEEEVEPPYVIVIKMKAKRDRPEWKEEENRKLLHLVPANTPPEFINWQQIAGRLGRTPVDCYERYTALQSESLKEGGDEEEGGEAKLVSSVTSTSPLAVDVSSMRGSPAVHLTGARRVESGFSTESGGESDSVHPHT